MRAIVYVSWGLWVADCPADGCPGAEHFGHAPISGHVGGLTQIGFKCAHCGLICPAEWPPREVCADVAGLLAMRPVPASRNWKVGEPVENLLAQNVEHGLLSAPELLPDQFTMGDPVTLMIDGLLTPHARAVVTSRAWAVLTAEGANGSQLGARADQLLAIGA